MNSKLIIAFIGVVLAASSNSQVLPKRVPHETAISKPTYTNSSENVDYKKIRSEQREKLLEELPNVPMSSISRQPSWNRGVDTNGVVITVYVGGIDNRGNGKRTFVGSPAFHLFRNLSFDKDGRLISVSPVIPGKYNPYVSNSNPSNVGQID